MSRRSTSLLVLLALLLALGQPLCLCRRVQLASSSNVASCCAPEESAPRPDAPCGEDGGKCECARDGRLVPVEFQTPPGVSFALAFAYELPAYAVEPARTPEPPRAALLRGRSPAPPGIARDLPLRI